MKKISGLACRGRGRRGRQGLYLADPPHFSNRGSRVRAIGLYDCVGSPAAGCGDKCLKSLPGFVEFPEIHQDDAEKVPGEYLLRPFFQNESEDPDRFREILFIEGDLGQKLMG